MSRFWLVLAGVLAFAATAGAEPVDTAAIKVLVDARLAAGTLLTEELTIVNVFEKKYVYFDGYQRRVGPGLVQSVRLEDSRGAPFGLEITVSGYGVASDDEARRACDEPELRGEAERLGRAASPIYNG